MRINTHNNKDAKAKVKQLKTVLHQHRRGGKIAPNLEKANNGYMEKADLKIQMELGLGQKQL